MLLITAQAFGRSSKARHIELGRQRSRAGRPDSGGRQYACDIRQPELCERRAQRDIRPIGRIGQHRAARNAGLTSPADLLNGNLRLGLECDLVRNTNLLSPLAIARPLLRQIETIGQRQAGIMIGDRQRHGDLTIVLLAELTAILTGNSD